MKRARVWRFGAANLSQQPPQRPTDYEEATAETRRRPAAVGARTPACLLALGSASLAQPFSSQLIKSQARAGGSPAPHTCTELWRPAAAQGGAGREAGAPLLNTKNQNSHFFLDGMMKLLADVRLTY